jgi:CAAX protease family protein
LVSYFVFAFGFSWLMLLPGLLTYYGVLSLSPYVIRSLAIAGLLGPTLSGFIMSAVTEGTPGLGRLLGRIVRWRVGLRWYLFAIVGLPAVVMLATFTRPGALESLDISGQPFGLAYLHAFISMALIGGPLFEEPGWTGFAQPRLQRLYGPLVGGLILGYLNLTMAAWILALVLVAATRGRIGYRPDADAV